MDYVSVTTALVAPTASLFSGGGPRDLIGLDDIKLELDLDEPCDDVYLRKIVSRASAAAQKFCNRLFVPATWRDQVYPPAGPFPWQLPPALSKLQLRQWPLTATPCPAGTAPPQAPTLTTVAASGLGALTYYARLTYLTPTGETAPSLESQIVCALNQEPAIAAPGPDAQKIATGYNVYLSTASMAQTKQNASPVSINQGWTLPPGGLVAGAAPPNYVTVVEGLPNNANPLAEGVDFLVDAAKGQLDRLWYVNQQPKPWSLPATVVYQAGYAAIPDDLQEAVILLAKMRYFARSRDPMLRNESQPGVYDAAYWLGTGLGGQGDLPVDVTEKLDRYRETVVK